MSDDDKAAYRQLLLIVVLSICGILFLVALGTLMVTYGCYEMLRSGTEAPNCSNGSLSKFVLEFVGLAIGMLGAIKLLGR
jgi:hypothetical protein